MKTFLHALVLLFCFSAAQSQTISIVSQTNSPCFNTCGGAVTFSISGATGPFTVTGGCSSSTSTAFPGNTITLTGLCPSCPLYNYIFTNGPFSIVGTKTVNISSPPPILAAISKTNVCCNGQCNGALSPTVTGGTPAYTFMWTGAGGPVGFSPNVSNLCAGTYTMNVLDANSCTYSFTSSITQPAPLTMSLSQAPTSCSSCCDGTINASASGGTSPYSYTVFPGGTNNSTGNFSNVCGGTYSVCMSDNGCCTSCGGITVTTSTATGISKQLADNLSIDVFPNPGNGYLKVRYPSDAAQWEYELYDILGKRVDKGKLQPELNLKVNDEGAYFLKISRNGTAVSQKKIVIGKE